VPATRHDLRKRIAPGEITLRVPSFKSLTQEFAIAQGTAERALAPLREVKPIRSAMAGGTSSCPTA
jgi:hypothetical protein